MTTSPEMPCAEFVERITDYLEGALPAADRKRLEDHLSECEDCSLYLAQLRRTLELAGELREEDVRPEVQSALSGVFAHWKQGRHERG